jgi:hypothetical protein
VVGKYHDMHFPCFNKATFVPIHKFLFSQLNAFVSRSLCASSDIWLSSTELVLFWRTAVQAYVYLGVNTRVKELRTVPFLVNCVREGRKFTLNVCSKQSTFLSLVDKDKMGHFSREIPKMLKELQW